MTKTILFLVVFALFITAVYGTSKNAKIIPSGVDDIKIGAPMPPSLAKSEKERIDLFIADGVPFKGFKFKNPSLMVSLEHNNVSMIVIDSADIKTKEGVGVGSTLKELESAYKNIRITHVPPTFGSDEAVAIIKDLPNVFFYFKDMNTVKSGGKAVRIMIFKQ